MRPYCHARCASGYPTGVPKADEDPVGRRIKGDIATAGGKDAEGGGLIGIDLGGHTAAWGTQTGLEKSFNEQKSQHTPAINTAERLALIRHDSPSEERFRTSVWPHSHWKPSQ